MKVCNFTNYFNNVFHIFICLTPCTSRFIKKFKLILFSPLRFWEDTDESESKPSLILFFLQYLQHCKKQHLPKVSAENKSAKNWSDKLEWPIRKIEIVSLKSQSVLFKDFELTYAY